MKLSEFNFNYPEELVAQSPLAERDQARLLVWDGRSGRLSDSVFSGLANNLSELFVDRGSRPILLIVNDSKVYPARIRIKKMSGMRGEVFILTPHREANIACLLRPLKKLKVGDVLCSERGQQPVFRVESLDPPRVENISGISLAELMNSEGEMPLPPYIVRDPSKVADPSLSALDKLRYQTVYARDEGSAAAPTAGLHFTPSVLNDCAQKNIIVAGVTLHVGLGTFQPVTVENINEHDMHEEICCLPQSTLTRIIEHTENGWPIIFVGTTALRTVESVLLRSCGFDLKEATLKKRDVLSQMLSDGRVTKEDLLRISDEWIKTDLFIRPSQRDFVYQPLCGEGIITNFHQPESTLVMLISSLLGYEPWRQLYQHAVTQRYRLFSYGDSSLLIFPGSK